jgi:hypothetical protein
MDISLYYKQDTATTALCFSANVSGNDGGIWRQNTLLHAATFIWICKLLIVK